MLILCLCFRHHTVATKWKKNMKMKNSLNLFRLDLSVGQLYSLEAVPAYLKYIPFPFIEFKAAEVCFVKIPMVSDSVKSTCWLAN